ncbi:MAG: SDR family oxidoreductase [Rhodospirillales bacterium]|jgi:NAD(P)-dependent dehydrogenase (short-subunit alcohol dehydrogenase family)|nr:short-chain dehydrogenase [Rhodospirillaceae bacterium]MDP6428304.1 SDR family oxidoreductase [Rhodospirillales bacterium]MDP6645567.1 SDR family oxidoreductase [Rhodospirillales bacterium]MDP6842788.1 SDR family oxidoreductase [Rhodospirillales bacterium]|tara:strand:- start:482 stop:1231 length:750 start_codon:yes stop_codon:yes gene_type:complete
MRLNEKTAIVTGAGGGIGEAVCRAFAAEGANLVCADINAEALSNTVSGIRDAGGRAIGVAGDAAEEAYAAQLVETAKGEFGGLSTIVTSAHLDVPYLPVTELPLEDWRRSIDVNLTGVFLLLKHAIPVMAGGGGGSIILVASQLARAPKPGRAWYASQKGALLSLAKALAVDHAAQNIRANTLSPGPTADARFFSQWPNEAEAHAHASTLFDRLGETHEMAAGAVFLASDESSFMTGTDLLIDGGYTAV